MIEEMSKDKIAAIKLAREIMRQYPLFLDTESTGLGDDDEIVDLAIVDTAGETVLDTLVQPTIPITPDAIAIHGIKNSDVFNAPSFADIIDELKTIVNNRIVVIYNADFDTRLIRQSASSAGADFALQKNIYCAMELYAQYHGDWNDYYQSYRWQRQDNAAKQLGIKIPANLHTALADAQLCRLIMMTIAATPLPGEAVQSSQLFIETFTSLAEQIHSTSVKNGFWPAEGRNEGEVIALIHSEISEALEAIRSGNLPDDKIPDFDGLEAELADAVIRIMDYSAGKELRLAEAIIAKMAYNENRPYKHGKEF